jgi:hypothetical protein
VVYLSLISAFWETYEDCIETGDTDAGELRINYIISETVEDAYHIW